MNISIIICPYYDGNLLLVPVACNIFPSTSNHIFITTSFMRIKFSHCSKLNISKRGCVIYSEFSIEKLSLENFYRSYFTFRTKIFTKDPIQSSLYTNWNIFIALCCLLWVKIFSLKSAHPTLSTQKLFKDKPTVNDFFLSDEWIFFSDHKVWHRKYYAAFSAFDIFLHPFNLLVRFGAKICNKNAINPINCLEIYSFR